MLIVAPMSGHHATLLRDTVRALLPDLDIWITDWIDARLVPITAGPFHLDDYVAYVTEFIQALGPDVLDQLAQHTGLSHDELLSRLTRELPNAVDKMTPDGRLPTEQEASRLV